MLLQMNWNSSLKTVNRLLLACIRNMCWMSHTANGARLEKMDSECFASTLDPVHTDLEYYL
jgi:hypothetical protein